MEETISATLRLRFLALLKCFLFSFFLYAWAPLLPLALLLRRVFLGFRGRRCLNVIDLIKRPVLSWGRGVSGDSENAVFPRGMHALLSCYCFFFFPEGCGEKDQTKPDDGINTLTR